ncbi:MAG TPA: addiction module protein [Tepidisphaeraceae bacterium]
MTVAQLKQQAIALNPQQRLRLVQDIWDSLVQEPESVRIPAAHRQLIDRRLAQHDANPDATITLAEAKNRLRKHLSSKSKK